MFDEMLNCVAVNISCRELNIGLEDLQVITSCFDLHFRQHPNFFWNRGCEIFTRL